ncbi:MAG: TonB-dependent receptor [Bacteroidia bacterium]|nr:TonB-dependent receptor [Bacteroidia bacterium]MBP7262030.1 TonB-dependent receptor [Bacteroidia bacterium]MBP9181239.1 TonB-dependent receptor [Bacteroidia bacterium]MBP9725452.1 TonB-dependent receptor [Bacteroidia bacterium]
MMWYKLKKICSAFLFFIAALPGYAQLSGTVLDSLTREVLPGATVSLNETEYVVATNEKGRFSFDLKEGTYTLKVTFIGHNTYTTTVVFTGKKDLKIYLSSSAVQGSEVLVQGRRKDENVKSSEMSTIRVEMSTLKNLPVVMGETDILKSITLLPGIKSGGEGSTGFYVRGGGPDQNLVLLDDAVIYNPAHLLGFFSVFNTDAVQDVEIVKGGMPANYGGRLSSVINVRTKEGNYTKTEGTGSIGLISSKMAVNGPIQKNKSSFSVGARRTYIDLLVQPFLPDSFKGNGYYFYDLNAKLDFKLGAKDKLSFTAYTGRDVFNFKGNDVRQVSIKTDWGNSFVTGKWQHLFSDNMSMATSLGYNTFRLSTTAGFSQGELILQSGIEDVSLKSDVVYRLPKKGTVKAGMQYIFHTFSPGIATGELGGVKLDVDVTKKYAHEGALYVNHEWEINSRWLVNYGLRYSLFNQVGPYEQMLFDANGEETDSMLQWKSGESVAFYQGLEPRVNVRYQLNNKSSVKASVTKVNQYLHLATSSGATLPSDLWVPSSGLVQPQISWQYVAGYYRNFLDNKIEVSVENYYKTMQNQIEFKPGANLFINQNLEGEMIFGDGLSYGTELLIQKKTGKTTGWIGYTLSKTTRTFEALNNGNPFDYRYDRRHDMSVVINHQLSERWQVGFVFVYGTGNALTLPTGRYAFNIGINNIWGIPERYDNIDQYGPVNNFRMPAYHRADISFTYLRKKTKHWESSWNFSVYNVYNRKNPYFIYFSAEDDEAKPAAYAVYLFPILPSVSWSFKFL